jgi:hypothetical protein
MPRTFASELVDHYLFFQSLHGHLTYDQRWLLYNRIETPQYGELVSCISSQYFLTLLSLNSTQVTETQKSLLQLEVTGTYLSDPAPIETKSHFSVSLQGAKSPPSQEPRWKRKATLCHCHSWGENMAHTIYAERRARRGVERESRCLVSHIVFYSDLRLIVLQCCTTILQYHTFSLCETHYAERYPHWKEGDCL